MAHGVDLESPVKEKRRVLVYQLGASSCNLTLLEAEGGLMRLIDTEGPVAVGLFSPPFR